MTITQRAIREAFIAGFCSGSINGDFDRHLAEERYREWMADPQPRYDTAHLTPTGDVTIAGRWVITDEDDGA